MRLEASCNPCFRLVLLLCLGTLAWAAKPLQLDSSIFQRQLEEVPADTKVLLEFYAHWCPACQRFAPEYEKLAAVLNAEPKPAPKVLVARVDCAEEVRHAQASLVSVCDVMQLLYIMSNMTKVEDHHQPHQQQRSQHGNPASCRSPCLMIS